jgi:hypothetical protein
LLHREVVWAISANFDQLSALMLSLWACGQRACVVHHVHSEVLAGAAVLGTTLWLGQVICQSYARSA